MSNYKLHNLFFFYNYRQKNYLHYIKAANNFFDNNNLYDRKQISYIL